MQSWLCVSRVFIHPFQRSRCAWASAPITDPINTTWHRYSKQAGLDINPSSRGVSSHHFSTIILWCTLGGENYTRGCGCVMHTSRECLRLIIPNNSCFYFFIYSTLCQPCFLTKSLSCNLGVLGHNFKKRDANLGQKHTRTPLLQLQILVWHSAFADTSGRCFCSGLPRLFGISVIGNLHWFLPSGIRKVRPVPVFSFPSSSLHCEAE